MARRGILIDPFSGMAGDMFLAALIDLGLPVDDLRRGLEALPLDNFRIEVRTTHRGALRATKLDVRVRRADGSEGQEGAGGLERPVDEGVERRPTASGPGHSAGPTQGHGHDAHAHPHPHPHAHDHDHGHGHRHGDHPHPHDHGHGHGDHAHSHDPGHGHPPGHDHGLSIGEIVELVGRSGLSPAVKGRALGIFGILAEAEGRIHGVPAASVRFHEVGAVDSIVDICGAAWAVEALDLQEIACRPIALGSGMRRMAHGAMPLPAPATLEILKGLPCRWSGVEDELVTPTGAAILKALVTDWAPGGDLRPLAAGYGAGTTNRADPANVVRVTLYERAAVDPAFDRVEVLECQVDDMTGEALGHLRERLEAAGALDVLFTALQMKKNRPGQGITVVARPDDAGALETILLRESTTLGVRRGSRRRRVLERRIESVETALGPARIKLAWSADGICKFSAEYEDCRRLAEASGRPLEEVRRLVEAAAAQRLGGID